MKRMIGISLFFVGCALMLCFSALKNDRLGTPISQKDSVWAEKGGLFACDYNYNVDFCSGGDPACGTTSCYVFGSMGGGTHKLDGTTFVVCGHVNCGQARNQVAACVIDP